MIPDYIIQAGRRRSTKTGKKKPKPVDMGHKTCRSCGALTNTVWGVKIKGVKGWLCGKCAAY